MNQNTFFDKMRNKWKYELVNKPNKILRLTSSPKCSVRYKLSQFSILNQPNEIKRDQIWDQNQNQTS